MWDEGLRARLGTRFVDDVVGINEGGWGSWGGGLYANKRWDCWVDK